MPAQASRRLTCLAAAFLLLINADPAIGGGQHYRDFITTTPLKQGESLIIGFMGGREPWNNGARSVRKLALKLRSMNASGVYVETLENRKRSLAIELITRAFDCDRDGKLDEHERSSARLILYGQSFGGAAVVKLARQLKQIGIPVLLTVQVDSVGRNDATIPSNVARAANLFQRNGWFIRGEPDIHAEDPSKTAIIGNFRFDYSHKRIDISQVSWIKKSFRLAHTRMEYDPDVWSKVEELILDAVQGSSRPKNPST